MRKYLALLIFPFLLHAVQNSSQYGSLKDKNVSKVAKEEEIDKIFLSFLREKKKKEKEARKKNKKTLALSIQQTPKNPASVVTGNSVYAKNPNLNTISSTPLHFKIKGVVCEGKRCFFFANNKRYGVGDMISPMEKILTISPKIVKTTMREVKY